MEIEQYKKALRENPNFFDWFDLLNHGLNASKNFHQDTTTKVKLEVIVA